MSAPNAADWSALLRLPRYLVLQPRALHSFPWRDEGAKVARSWTPTSLGASALGDPRVAGSACAECILPSTGPPRRDDRAELGGS
eukprot:287116-Alexandrium_andersonii.AAC.1